MQTALERYERPLIQYAMSIVQSLDRARDVVQETFMRLHKQEQAKIEGTSRNGCLRFAGIARSSR